MGEFSIYHWLIVALILILVFGARRIPELMKGLGEGIRSFKQAISGEPPRNTTAAHANNPPESK